MIVHQWYGCYAANWNLAPLVPEAFSHPAKVAFGLAERIYQHLLAEGYVQPGSVVADPFAGVGGFAFHCLYYGLHFKGCELEEKFVNLARENFALWDGRYKGVLPRWGTAEIVQGDSRNLVQVLGIGGTAVIASPPYADAINAETSIDWEKTGRPDRNRPSANRHNTMTDGMTKYGESDGQLGSMTVVSSPPFLGVGLNADKESNNRQVITSGTPTHREGALIDLTSYGSTPNNIGNATGDDFWSSAKIIVEQCYQLLSIGGVAAFVTGDFVRQGQRVEFGKQWLALCQSVGFAPLEHIVAWKTEPGPIQTGLLRDRDTTINRVSFFRLLNINKTIAAKHWRDLDEQAQASYLQIGRDDLESEYQWKVTPQTAPTPPVAPTLEALRQYEAELEEYERWTRAAKNEAVPPTPGRILSYAQKMAWHDNGSEKLDVDAAVLNEDVYIVQKV